MTHPDRHPLNAFCVDLEEWFHILMIDTPDSDIANWDGAESCVVGNTEVLLELLDHAKVKGTFLTLGWIAEKYPELVRRISDNGHEIGSHGYYHKLIFEQTCAEFREEIVASRRLLQDLTGQPVNCFRAPGFSMVAECLWAYEILAEEGLTIDVSIVPAARDHGGIERFDRRPFLMRTCHGDLKVFPVSVMKMFGRVSPFSGGGYLRLFPMYVIKHGFRQNHAMGLPVMVYIHPREIDPTQPRLKLPRLKAFKYYVGLKGCHRKLTHLLETYPFGTVSEVVSEFQELPMRTLENGKLH